LCWCREGRGERLEHLEPARGVAQWAKRASISCISSKTSRIEDLKNPLSPLLDAGFIEAALRRHFQPLLDPELAEALTEHYPHGVLFVINGRRLEPEA